MNNLILQANNVEKEFKGVKVLKGVDCNLFQSNITFLIGPSGCGKSTFLNCLSGSLKLDEGEIYFDKTLIANNQIDLFNDVYPNITSVSQGYTLWPHLTNLQNITLSKHSGNIDEIYNYAERFKISKILNKYPYECSGGERQRISLLRHIALKPKVLLLDEITSALDVEQIQVLSDILLELKERATSIFFITHLLSLVPKIGNDFIFVDNGLIVEKGLAKDFTKPKTERLESFLNIYGLL